MAEGNDDQVDLFGQPWQEPGETRGRPAHVFNPQIAETVAVLRATGMKEADIATRVGLSEPTLRKYYFRQLEGGPTMARALLREKLWERAMAGNVSALKALETIFDKGEAAVPLASQPVEPKVEHLGKKAQAEVDAEFAHKGTSWGDLLQ